MRATISILGLNTYDPKIWDNFQVPTQANKEDIIDEIMLECSDFELLYPDWDVMYNAIGLWSRKELPIWQRLYDAKELEYNPLWNVDAKIDEVRDVTDNRSYEDATEGNKSEDLTEVIDETNNSNKENTSNQTNTENYQANGTNLHQSNTFNSDSLIDNSKDISNNTANSSEILSKKDDEVGKDVRDFDRTQGTTGTYDENKSGKESKASHDVYKVVRQGNIGVTSSQQLLTEEWEVSQLDPEQYIIDSFKQRFCLLLY